MRLRLLVVLAAMLAPLAIPSTASAAPPVFHETFRDTFSAPNEEDGPLVCGASTFSEEGRVHGNDLVKPVPGSDEAFLGHSNYSFRATYVNLQNGKSFSVRVQGLFKEQTAELVDAEAPFDYAPPRDENGNPVALIGPLYRFTAIEVAHFQVRDSRNRLVHNLRGRILWEAIFDTRGDGVPGGVLVTEEEPVMLSGTFPFLDFCDVALDLTT